MLFVKKNRVPYLTVIIFLFAMAICLDYANSSVFLFSSLIVFCQNKAIKMWRLVGLLYLLVILFFININILSFQLMPQASALYTESPIISEWLLSGHVHALRLLASSPGILLSKIFAIDLTKGMSIFTALLFWFIYENIGQGAEEISSRRSINHISNFFLLLPMMILPFIMNGRLVFSFCGYSLVILQLLKLQKRPVVTVLSLALLALGCFMCCVSSGTLIVCVATVIYLLFSLAKKQLKRKLKLILVSTIFAIPIFFYIQKMVAKLFAFYGHGAQGLHGILTHGLGGAVEKIFSYNSMLPLLALALSAAPFIFVIVNRLFFIKNKKNRFYVPCISIFISAVSFPVGYSAGVMTIIPLIMLCCVVSGARACGKTTWASKL